MFYTFHLFSSEVVVIGFEQSSYTVAEGSQTGRLSVCANISQDNLIDNVAINARVFSMDGTTISKSIINVTFENYYSK